MLSAEERDAIEAHRPHYPDARALSVEALKAVQERRGWISDEALADVAAHLGLPVAELEGVATFYNLLFRRPVGRHVALVCDSVSCWIMGCEALFQAFAERYGIEPGQTDAAGRLTLLPVPCLGACERAPAMTVDGDLHGNVTPETLQEVLARYA